MESLSRENDPTEIRGYGKGILALYLHIEPEFPPGSSCRYDGATGDLTLFLDGAEAFRYNYPTGKAEFKVPTY